MPSSAVGVEGVSQPTEVMVNRPDDVYVERGGRIEKVTDGLFEGEEPVLHLIERIVGPLGLRVEESPHATRSPAEEDR